MQDDNLGAWWVAREVVVPAAVAAPIIWWFLDVFFGPPLWEVVLGWSVLTGSIVVFIKAARINATGRRVDEESRVLRPGYRNRRP